MGKRKGGQINPVDQHRKQQRKKELKKNKDGRKKTKVLTTSTKDAQAIFEELASIEEMEQHGVLDRATQMRKEALGEKLARIQESRQVGTDIQRKQAGLPTIARPTKRVKVAEEDYKWYHPTFNPHGPKKPAKFEYGEGEGGSDSDDSESSDGSDEEESEK
ncbi:hypothetical protein HK101_004139, partial [Irineochytrium annulatum]